MAREKKYLAVVNFVDGRTENQLVTAGEKLHVDVIVKQILHSYNEFSINDKSGDPTIKQISIIPIKGDIFEYSDLDMKFNETKQKFIDIVNGGNE
jgi:hypothetical protein